MSTLEANTLRTLDKTVTVEVADIPTSYQAAGVGSVIRTVRDKLRDFLTFRDFSTTAAFNAAKAGQPSFDGKGRLRAPYLIAGDAELSGSTDRDAIVVGRTVEGATDCHAFADRTVLSNVTDYGGYGTFDATTVVAHNGTHNHVFSFQDRPKYAGGVGGILENQIGLYSRPELTGTGHVASRRGVHIYDIVNTGGGTIGENVGVQIDDLAGANRVAIAFQQSAGFGIYAPGGAASYHKGRISTGRTTNETTNGFEASSTTTGPTAFLDATTTEARLGMTGEGTFGFYAGGGKRFEVGNAGSEFAFQGPADLVGLLGTVIRRLRAAYIDKLFPGTGTAMWTSGVGSPQGVLVALPGSLYTNTSGGANTTLWVKETGTGNTGWVAK